MLIALRKCPTTDYASLKLTEKKGKKYRRGKLGPEKTKNFDPPQMSRLARAASDCLRSRGSESHPRPTIECTNLQSYFGKIHFLSCRINFRPEVSLITSHGVESTLSTFIHVHHPSALQLAVADRHQVRFRVEHKLVEVDLVAVVAEQQVKVLQRLAEPERLHHVLGPRVKRTLHVPDGRVAMRDLRVLLERLEDRPAHVLVRLVAGDGVEVVKALDELRAQQVVRVVGLNVDIGGALAGQAEVSDFGREVRRLLHVRLIARLEQLVGQREVRLRHAVLVAEQEGPRQVARQVVHLWFEVLAADQLSDVNVMLGRRFLSGGKVKNFFVDVGSAGLTSSA